MKEFSILALGGNEPSKFGSPKLTLSFALKSLEKYGVITLKESHLYNTPAFPAGSGPDFVNSAALVESNRKPAELLDILHKVEEECGRVRKERWGARTLDIDLIDHAGRVFPNNKVYQRWSNLSLKEQQIRAPEQLILPHPRVQDRAFVLIPLLDVCPDWKHPVLGLSVQEMVAKLPESARNEVVRL